MSGSSDAQTPACFVRRTDGSYRKALTAKDMPEAIRALRTAGLVYDDSWHPIELVKMKGQAA